MTRVRYDHWRTGLDEFPRRLRDLIDVIQPRTVCEIGGGAKPALTLDEVRERDLDYTTLDISQAELDKAPAGYKTLLMDIATPHPDISTRYDFMFSNMVAEHIRDPRLFHHNVLAMLNPGGVVAHLMPTLYEPAFVANLLLPEKISESIVRRLAPHRDFDGTGRKFPAYYRWCRGPSRRNLDRFQRAGFEVEEAAGYFGTSYLGEGLVGQAYDSVSRALVNHPTPVLCSYLWLILRRREQVAGGPPDRRDGTPPVTMPPVPAGAVPSVPPVGAGPRNAGRWRRGGPTGKGPHRRTPEGSASSNGYMVTWIPYHGRSAALARHLGLTPVWAPRWPHRIPAPIRYAAAAARTVKSLGRSSLPVIVAQPPLPALLVVLMSRGRRRAPLLADMHSGAFLDPRWRRFLAPTLHLLRGDAAIVTNANLASVCQRAGVRSFVLDDPLEPAEAPAVPASHDPYVLVVLSYASDEPVPEILEAASRRADRRFVCTGAAPEPVRRSAPPNVSFPGFVPRDEFVGLLRGSSVVLALTTRPDTMQRAAYEALEHGVPVVTSDTQVLRDYFGDAAVYASGTATSIDAAIEEALRRNSELRASLVRLQSRRLSEQQRALREVATYLRRR